MFEVDSTQDATDRESTPAEPEPSAADSRSSANPLTEEATRTQPNVRFIRGWLWRALAVVGEVAVAFVARELVAHQQPRFAPLSRSIRPYFWRHY